MIDFDWVVKIVLDIYAAATDISAGQGGQAAYARFKKGLFLCDLMVALSDTDMGAIAQNIRRLSKAGISIPPEMAVLLADLIDPERVPISSGPKPTDKRERDYFIGLQYRYLCTDVELAKAMVYREKKVFALVTPYNFLEETIRLRIPGWKWPFPGWKYPDRERERNQYPKPLKQDIKALLMQGHGIESRQLDTILARNKGDIPPEIVQTLALALDKISSCGGNLNK